MHIQANTGRSQEPGGGQGNAQQGPGPIRSGQAGGMCMGQDVGGVTPQNQRLQEVLRLMGGLEPMHVAGKANIDRPTNTVKGCT